MTFAPTSIKDARKLLLTHLDFHPGTSPPGNLDPDEVGIVGDTDHAEGGTSYHLGESQLRDDAYSVVESSRDRHGLTDAAAALDIGLFQLTLDGRTHTLRTFSRWLVDQCDAQTDDTQDIREVIYSLDGQEVKRWDRLKIRTTGDEKHRTHTHVSYFRDSESRPKTPLYRRFLTEIGLLEDDMDQPTFNARMDAWWLARMSPDAPNNKQRAALRVAAWQQEVGQSGRSTHNVLFGDMLALLKQAAGDDAGAVVTGALAGLSPSELADAITEALPPEQARQAADELAARLKP